MSNTEENNKSLLVQDRRQWLKTTAAALGTAFLPLTSISGTAEAEKSQPVVKSSPARLFSPKQHILIEELSETIIPADSRSGGAKAAGVAEYIEQVVRESVNDDQRVLWKEGLSLIDQMSQHHHGKSFVDSSPEERVALLMILSDHDDATELPEVRFFLELKRLTVRGYYTSEIGIHDELQYKGNKLLLEYVGCDHDSEHS